MITHSLLSPSSAERWMTCPGSIPLSLGIEPTSSEFAEEGTIAHEAASKILLGLSPEDSYKEASDKGFDAFEMKKHIQIYIDFVKSIGGSIEVEVKGDLSLVLGENSYGYSDAIVRKDDELWVIDLKYGMSPVKADHNPQIALYAASYLNVCCEYDPPETIHMCIVQPRIKSIDIWEPTNDEYDSFILEIEHCAGIARSMVELPEKYWLFRPSTKACKFCPANISCRALADTSRIDSETKPAMLSPGEISEEFGKTKLSEIWIKSLKQEVFNRLASGSEVPGYKLIEGRKGVRQWNNSEEVISALKKMRLREDQMYDKKLVSPSKVERLLEEGAITKKQWEKLSPLIIQNRCRPSIVEESDKRKPLETMTKAEDYPNMEEQQNG